MVKSGHGGAALPDLPFTIHDLPLLNLPERLIEVGDDVPDVFEADRDSDEPVGDAYARARLRKHRGVGHRRRVRDERLDAAETLGERAEADGFHATGRVLGGA